ncbi:diadenylate cyclase [Natronomonas gomsonensis]|uniref:diadenylate cyclase n=1 Tax=Natronomonas gomsonensis TaxID=1046043 RepID=UPI0015C061EF|nr:diadenylate cyclase [Natronomonas gomsonensis]
MTSTDPLDIEYRSHERVQELIDRIRVCVEDVSLSFERWEEPYVTGPGLYFAVVSGPTVGTHADAMGNNRWPDADSRDVLADVDAFYEATTEVARTRDGAVVVSVDGVVQEQLVRFRSYSPDSAHSSEHCSQYADWMGSRHMSALDTSARPDVVTTITLSAETGRVTVFEEGEYTTTPREELTRTWVD